MPPELTVVIPTHNRRPRLQALLESLDIQSESPVRFDAVVVIDGSTDGTEEMVLSMETGYRLGVVPLARGGAARARNRGAARAMGRYLLFLDDDMIADPQLVTEHLRAQKREGDVVGIGMIDQLPRTNPSRWTRSLQEQRREYFDRLADAARASFMSSWGGNLCVPRELFSAAGGFKEALSAHDMPLGFPMHDIEFGYRLGERGARFVFVERARTTEDDQETLRYALRDQERRGRAELILYELHPAILPRLEIGGRPDIGMKLCRLRRVLLALRIPPFLVALLAAAVPGRKLSTHAYRLLFSYCRWRGIRRAAPDRETWSRLRKGTTILMYHAIGRPGEPASRYIIPERRFRRQMAWLKRGGFNVIGLDELVRCMREHRLPPAKSVVLTFDDGYKDFELALPVLERLGFPYTIFLPSAAGTMNAWSRNPELRGRELIEIEKAAAFIRNGSVGAHTRTHVDLVAVGREEAKQEIAGSKAELEMTLGQPVRFFAYPYGRHDEEIERLVREAGFEAACSVTPGPNQPAADLYGLNRYEVCGSDSLLRFAQILLFGKARGS